MWSLFLLFWSPMRQFRCFSQKRRSSSCCTTQKESENRVQSQLRWLAQQKTTHDSVQCTIAWSWYFKVSCWVTQLSSARGYKFTNLWNLLSWEFSGGSRKLSLLLYFPKKIIKKELRSICQKFYLDSLLQYKWRLLKVGCCRRGKEKELRVSPSKWT